MLKKYGYNSAIHWTMNRTCDNLVEGLRVWALRFNSTPQNYLVTCKVSTAQTTKLFLIR